MQSFVDFSEDLLGPRGTQLDYQANVLGRRANSASVGTGPAALKIPGRRWRRYAACTGPMFV